MAGVKGVEPLSTGPEPVVLPLNDTPIWQVVWESNPPSEVLETLHRSRGPPISRPGLDYFSPCLRLDRLLPHEDRMFHSSYPVVKVLRLSPHEDDLENKRGARPELVCAFG